MTAIEGVTSMAARDILNALGALHEREGGKRVRFQAMGGVDAARQVREGRAFDVIALAADALQALEAEGFVRTGSRVDYARSGVALAVPAGAPHPAITSAEEVRAAMLAARRVATSTGPSGAHLKRLWDQWGIAQEMQARSVVARPGTPVASLLARGEADLGVQQYSELLGQDGVDVLGPLPGSLQQFTVFAAAIGAQARAPDDVVAFLRFLTTPQARAVIETFGMTGGA